MSTAILPLHESDPHKRAGIYHYDEYDREFLRERVAEQYAAPFDVIFSSPVALAAVGEIDRTRAAVLLLGPIVLGKLSTLPDFDYREIIEAVVDGFLATHIPTSTPDACA